jgi:hypothetical protein
MARMLICGVYDTADHRALIHEALNAVDAAGGGEVVIADGTHYIGPVGGADTGDHSLKIGDNTQLEREKGTKGKRKGKRGRESLFDLTPVPFSPPLFSAREIRGQKNKIFLQKSAAHSARVKESPHLIGRHAVVRVGMRPSAWAPVL